MRTLELSKKIDLYSDSRTLYGQIVGITIPPLSDVPLLKEGIYNPFNREQIKRYILFSMSNFDEETLKMVLNNARESIKSSAEK